MLADYARLMKALADKATYALTTARSCSNNVRELSRQLDTAVHLTEDNRLLHDLTEKLAQEKAQLGRQLTRLSDKLHEAKDAAWHIWREASEAAFLYHLNHFVTHQAQGKRPPEHHVKLAERLDGIAKAVNHLATEVLAID